MSNAVPASASPSTGIDGTIRRASAQWTDFWFAPADPSSLCLMRILVGGMLIYSHVIWGFDLQAFLGPDGWNSAELVDEFQRRDWRFSFWWDVPVESMQTVHTLCIAILVLFCLGFCTRVTSVLSCIVHVSYCQRAPLSNFGLDQIGGILLLYLSIGPSGARYSLDGLIRTLWNQWRSAPGLSANGIRLYSSARLATRLIQIHYCVIYFFAAVGKSQGELWWTGEAMWHAFANYEYQSIDLTWLAWCPEFLELGTHVTFLWEISFAYLVWIRPLRPLMLAMGIMMHLGIGAFLGMWTFGWMMIFGYLAFVDPFTVRQFVEWPAARRSAIPASGSSL